MKKAIITADLLFGDSGKGTVVDCLTTKHVSTLTIRYNGGAQCAHNVYADGKHFCFHQLGSGSFNRGADTVLLDTVIVNPMTLWIEILEFKSQFGYEPNVYIHEDALVTTPSHMAANRAEERKRNHGSCGMGVWKTVEYANRHKDAIRIKDMYDSTSQLIRTELRLLGELGLEQFDERDIWSVGWSLEQISELLADLQKECPSIHYVNDAAIAELIDREETIIFEGAQGVLLDKDRGFVPHVSATDTTTWLAEQFLKRINYTGDVIKLGIMRSYATRHGVGPLPTEVTDARLVGEDNVFNEWQKNFRIGRFDPELINYALSFCPVDDLFITCLDNDPFRENDQFLVAAERIAEQFNLPLMGISFGKERSKKEFTIGD